jgi:hypothetical protein
MAWRVLELGDDVWNVSVAAERRASSDQWELVLCYRSNGNPPKRFWATTPMQSSSKGSLYSLAEKLSDRELLGYLNEHLSRR